MEMERYIVPGIKVNPSGQAMIEPALNDVLFDLALKLEGMTDLPVDVQHVVAAIVLAERNRDIDSQRPISSDDSVLASVLEPHVKAVFALYGGEVGSDD